MRASERSDGRAVRCRMIPRSTPIRIRSQRSDLRTIEADALVVALLRDTSDLPGPVEALDAALDGAIRERIAAGDLSGRAGQVVTLYPRGAVAADRILVVGVGARGELDLEAVRRAAAAAAKQARALGASRLAFVPLGAGATGLAVDAAAQATAEGASLALYRVRRPASADDGHGIGGNGSASDEPDADDRTPAGDAAREVREIVLVGSETTGSPTAGGDDGLEAGVARADAVVAGVLLTRDLVNAPPNVLTPSALADAAREVGGAHGLDVHVGDRAWIAGQGMGALLAVARGSRNDPRFVTLAYDGTPDGTPDGAPDGAPDGTPDGAPHVVLVGKGVTFDSGGLTLKSRTGLITMKSDMAGAGAALGAIDAVARLGLPLRVTAVLACVENMPDGNAYRPSDVITAGDGTTIEIISTDAEGRLALADALHWTKRLEPSAVIDLATLTGSAVTALGRGVAAGLFSNDDALAARLAEAGAATHERAWRLPLYDDYRSKIQTDVADLKNTGGAGGGVGTSAVFLEHFTEYPWAHLDIAPVAYHSKATPYTPKGATGFGVRLLVEALRRWPAAGR